MSFHESAPGAVVLIRLELVMLLNVVGVLECWLLHEGTVVSTGFLAQVKGARLSESPSHLSESLMRLLHRGIAEKALPIDIPPIESRRELGKTQRKEDLWCLSSVRSGFSLVWGILNSKNVVLKGIGLLHASPIDAASRVKLRPAW
ncbi:hypothetical protein DEO72_LG8g2463 [Vigna unguiculata]|uniref:Uncharacterized protein n=1 Tax=Vigna unguiculata TaxID=3917 RepID=A0A4D6MGK3_VIGUN|nr:hypothetical protein DEO72_LG7g689 [Vigna unguiculata]QCE04427.1 hypothetical protein DEO72_LG8g2463 [Vigna unguiculata]